MPLTQDELHHLPDVISGPRFGTYLRARGNDRAAALMLYRWNLEVSAAFMGSLHLCEIAMRNGIADAIEAAHGSRWPWTEGFIRSVPSAVEGYNAQRDLRNCAERHRTAGKVIAGLKFVFWEKMLTSRFQRSIWQHHFSTFFPGYDGALGINGARAACRDNLEDIRLLRNRIAHHEPIFARNLQDDFDRIERLVRWRNPTAADWLIKIETVTPLIETQP